MTEEAFWNRERLYAEVWEQPASKVATKYGVSDVMIGKICRKLQIPVPGRGYWARKQAGQQVKQIPLPAVANIPVIERFKFPATNGETMNTAVTRESEPTDAEYLRIVEVEAKPISFDRNAVQHKLISAAAKTLARADADRNGILQPPYNQRCLDIRVSQQSLNRALSIMNAIIRTLEAEQFPVVLTDERHATGSQIFGQRAEFEIVEKLRQRSRREEKNPNWTSTIIEYEPSGELEFRTRSRGYGPGPRIRDGKKRRLENELAKCVGLVMREGRSLGIQAKQQEQQEIERQKKQREMNELRPLVWEEEKKLREFEDWVSAWAKAQQMRDFIAALEKLWIQQGHDLSTEAPKGQRIIWMKQQADRKDPMVASPPSVLDRKGELNSW